jgi:peptide deformylase
MALLEILEFPDKRLRKIAQPVTEVTDEIRQLTEDMLETMYDAPGVGLAATQVNVHQRVVVIDTSEEQDQPLVFINPSIEPIGDIEPYQEGCLSVPGFYEDVNRAQHVKVTALNANGEEFTMEADELLAICIQHECDHLDGKLFVDYISPLKRNRIKSKLQKQHKLQGK